MEPTRPAAAKMAQAGVQADWENREFVETVASGARRITEFLNNFGTRCFRDAWRLFCHGCAPTPSTNIPQCVTCSSLTHAPFCRHVGAIQTCHP